jgi:CubicO group peptidase (beta-lactamase class C family)
LRLSTRFGLGYMLAMDNQWRPARQADSLILGPHAFGHTGFGGAIGFADPAHRLSYGYTMNRMSGRSLIGRRSQSLIDATYRSLGAVSTDSGAWR